MVERVSDEKVTGAIRGLERLKSDFKMVGSNAITIERAMSTLRALSAYDKERQTPEGWKAIDSAPKDGTEILLYGPGVLFMDGRTSMYAKARHIGWWHNDFWVTRDPAVTCRATNWMPLAAIPAPDAPSARTLLQSTEGQ